MNQAPPVMNIVDMDLAPFSAIDPWGYPGLPVTQTKDLGVVVTADQLARSVMKNLDA